MDYANEIIKNPVMRQAYQFFGQSVDFPRNAFVSSGLTRQPTAIYRYGIAVNIISGVLMP